MLNTSIHNPWTARILTGKLLIFFFLLTGFVNYGFSFTNADSIKTNFLNNKENLPGKLLLDSIKSFIPDTVKLLKPDKSLSYKNSYQHKKTIGQNFIEDAGIFLKDWGSFLTIPLRMKGTDWLIGTGVISGTILSSLADKRIKNSISNPNYNNDPHNFYNIFTHYGFIYYQGALAGAAYLTGLLIKNDDIRETARMILQSLTYSGTLVIGLRFLFNRERPAITDDPYKFKWLKVTSLDTQSFPSGHTAVAFAVSTILAERIGTWWSRALFYGAAAFTGFAKLRTNQHWFSDVVFGAVMGFGASWFVLKQEEKREHPDKKSGKSGGRFSFYPSFNGFGLVYKL